MELHVGRTRSGVGVVQATGAVPVRFLVVLTHRHPIVLAVLDATGILEGLGEELAQVVVVGGVFEAQVSNVRKVLVELLGEALAQLLDGRRLLLLANLFVLLLVGGRLETLPRKTATEEVHEDVSQRLQVVSPRLLTSQVCVDAHVTSRARERFPLAIGNVLLRLRIAILLGHAKVDHVDDVGRLGTRSANQEVIGFDIPVDEILLVDGLDTRQLLSCVVSSRDASKIYRMARE